MNRGKRLPWRVALLGAAALLAGACDEPTNTPVASPDLMAMQADQVMYDMVSYLTASGVRQGRVQADTAYVYTDSSKIVIRGLQLVFYNEDGRARATVTAREGEINQTTDAMVARGNVVLVVHEDGRKIESPELHYDPDRDKIWSDSTTVQTEKDGTVTRGSAFESDLEFRNVRISNIRGGGNIIF
ncbi:MAG: LPS export ABC transporter periplasmic protein LptC [Gemmatimonadota bacterium]